MKADRVADCRCLAESELENGTTEGTGQFNAREPETGFRNACHRGIPERGDIPFMYRGQRQDARQKTLAVPVQCAGLSVPYEP